MENYTLNILFNENSLDIDELDIRTLVIFNKKISDKIKKIRILIIKINY